MIDIQELKKGTIIACMWDGYELDPILLEFVEVIPAEEFFTGEKLSNCCRCIDRFNDENTQIDEMDLKTDCVRFATNAEQASYWEQRCRFTLDIILDLTRNLHQRSSS